ncbi:MAG: hypothetical protein K8R92_01155 [Planctomycetes bacterium]|nr:hypothetical protein [Planctomycetota bacterium]
MKQDRSTDQNQTPRTRNKGTFLRSLGLALVVAVPMVSLWSGSFVNIVKANSTGVSGLGSAAPSTQDLEQNSDRNDRAPGVILVPEEEPTLQGAIDRAGDGSVIIVAPGEYRENLSIRGRKVSLWAMAGAEATVLSGDGREGPIAMIEDSKVSFEGFQIQNGRGENGCGALLERSNGTFTDCRFMNNKGGLAANDSQVQLDHCVVAENNSSYAGGGLRATKSEVRLSDSEFNHNAAGTFGGGVYASGTTMRLYNVGLVDNRVISGAWGGGLYADGGNLEVDACLISGNASNVSGAGIYAFGVRARIYGTDFEGNVAANAMSVDGEHTLFDIQNSPLEIADETLVEAAAEPAPLTLASDN